MAIRPAHIQLARLVSGLILFAFVATHLLNHALGNISLEAMEAGRRLFLLLWRNPVGTLAFYGALAVHVLAVGYAFARRRSLKMPAGEAVQLVFGALIPLLLAVHVVANRGAHEVWGINDTYAYVVLSLWVWDWPQGLLQTVGTLLVWTHGCLGLHYWLRLKDGYPRWRTWLFAGALLLPAVSLSGFAGAGKQAALLVRDPVWRAATLSAIDLPQGAAQAEAVAWVYGSADAIRAGTLATFAGLFGFRFARRRWLRRGRRVVVGYPEGRSVSVPLGTSVLEASRTGNIPHASVCGGRGRCSTCRVRVVDGHDGQPPPSEEERKVLLRVGCPEGVRLACQLRPAADLAVVPLLPPSAGAHNGHARPGYLQGAEREIAILFADLRSFTQFSETKLPFDVVFALNQYFRCMGEAVERSGGRLDKFIGDGVMALFGVRQGAQVGCRNALMAAREMALALDGLNRQLGSDLKEPLRMGIGIHAGPAIVGEMGYRQATSLTAIGDSVNTASRLESMSKEFAVQLVVSRHVAELAGVDLSAYEAREVPVRGRAEALTVYLVPDARGLQIPDR